jgi:hypothetical protein
MGRVTIIRAVIIGGIAIGINLIGRSRLGPTSQAPKAEKSRKRRRIAVGRVKHSETRRIPMEITAGLPRLAAVNPPYDCHCEEDSEDAISPAR